MTFLLFFILSQHVFAQCWREVAAGTYHTLAIRSDGTLWAWGLNDKGQLGDGTTVNKNVPTKIGTDTNWATIDAFGDNSMALKTDGSLWCWGNNYVGQIGDGNHGNGIINTTPTHIGTDTDWVKISTGGRMYAIKSNATLWGWGYNVEGQLGVGNTNPYYIPIQIGTDTWIDISGGGNQTLAIKTNHTLWGWGFNKSGSLAIGPPDDAIITTPTQTGNNTADWAKVEIGGPSSSKMIKTDGSLWAMGNNTNGNIGNGTSGNGSASIVNTPTQTGSDNDWNSITTDYHSLGIKNDGTLLGFGANNYGQLGDGTLISKSVPTLTGAGMNWLIVKAGWFHSVAIDSEGTLYTTGSNDYGQLGDGTLVSKNFLTPVGSNCSLATTNFSKANMLQLYPNPANDNCSITMPNNEIVIHITIVNALGQTIQTISKTEIQANTTFEIAVKDYPKGMYLVKVKTAKNSYTSKLIKN